MDTNTFVYDIKVTRDCAYRNAIERVESERKFQMEIAQVVNEIGHQNIISITHPEFNESIIYYKKKSIVSLIVAKSRNNVIGKNGEIPWRLKEDMKHFKKLTTGNVVIMGRKTYESIGKPLPNRVNVVLTHDPNSFKSKIGVKEKIEIQAYRDLEDAIFQSRYDNPGKEIFIIGGESVYREALDNDLVERLYITTVRRNIEGGTAFFPKLECYHIGNASIPDIVPSLIHAKTKVKYESIREGQLVEEDGVTSTVQYFSKGC